jgi:glyoxylase-like metal-dependent hydrolase (beta-lactamase superfamily II)
MTPTTPIINQQWASGQIREVANGIYQLKLPIPNESLQYVLVYLIQGKNGFTLIDTGWDLPETLAAWEALLTQLGIGWQDIEQILVTHFHVDHAGMSAKIGELSGAKVHMFPHNKYLQDISDVDLQQMTEQANNWLLAHGMPKRELEIIEMGGKPDLKWLFPTKPDIHLTDGEVIAAGNLRLEVIHTPGHADNHICFYEPNQKILFSGDHVLPNITPNVSRNPLTPFNPLGSYLSSLHRLKDIEVTLVLPGHEDLFNNLAQRAVEIESHHRLRMDEIINTIAKQEKPSYEIAATIKWGPGSWQNLTGLDRYLAVMEVLAHIDLLSHEGFLKQTLRDEMIYYALM